MRILGRIDSYAYRLWHDTGRQGLGSNSSESTPGPRADDGNGYAAWVKSKSARQLFEGRAIERLQRRCLAMLPTRRPAPMLAVYAEELLRAVLAEDRAAGYYEEFAGACTHPLAMHYLAQLQCEADRHAARVAQLLKTVDPEMTQDAAALEGVVEGEITAHVACSSLDTSNVDDLLRAVIRLEMFLLTQYRKARDTARYLSLGRDRTRLTGLYEAKSARLASLELLLESCVGKPEKSAQTALDRGRTLSPH